MSAATLAAGQLCQPATGAPGDLDPAFADHGRTSPLPDFEGPAWSVDTHDGSSFVFAGGQVVVVHEEPPCYYEDFCVEWPAVWGYAARLSGTGSTAPDQGSHQFSNTQMLDLSVQPDGSAIGVGRRSNRGGSWVMVVSRLRPGGSLDSEFGNAGVAELPPDIGDAALGGSSLVTDPDGRIVVAVTRGNALVVVRFLPNGELDSTFGIGGVFTLDVPDSELWGSRPIILRTATGGYRVATSAAVDWQPNSRCVVVALTSEGSLDASFGTAGLADVGAPRDTQATCSSMASQPDGKLLIAGTDGSRGFTIRLLSSGGLDPGFAAPAVGAAMTQATALQIGADGAVTVAGRSDPDLTGALVMRLQADGRPDPLFGNAGLTWIDLPSDYRTDPIVHDMVLLPDGGTVVAGGALKAGPVSPTAPDRHPFVARLLGTEGGNSPGVIGFERHRIAASSGNSLPVVVRRMGGGAGAVSATYQIAGGCVFVSGSEPSCRSSTGNLTWSDGDRDDKEIVMPAVEGSSLLLLDAPQGGAGLGTRLAVVEVAGDTHLLGTVSFDETSITVTEGPGGVPRHAELLVHRQHLTEGYLAVVLTPTAGSAEAWKDFDGTPIRVEWPGGDAAPRKVAIPIVSDQKAEPTETFSVRITSASGGLAVVGPTTATVTISDADRNPARSGQSGGGSSGWASILLAVLLGLLRRWGLRPAG